MSPRPKFMVDLAPRAVIEDRILEALEEHDVTAILASREDLDVLIEALQVVRFRPSFTDPPIEDLEARRQNLLEGLRTLRREAFP